MLLSPAIMALLAGSLLTGALVLYGAFWGLRIVRHFDLKSGSEAQLRLERRTYLVSTLVANAFWFSFASFFLFIHTADRLHPYFTGAMCAAGSLYASVWGYPALVLKLLTGVGVGLWLILNFAGQQGEDYPLIRVKYRLLLCLTPLVVAEAAAQALYFGSLRPELITSCCGALFTASGSGVGIYLLTLPAGPLCLALAAGLAALLAAGIFVQRTGQGGRVFAAASLAAFLLGLIALLGLISPYVYELPSHHCPFCLLKGEYGWVGYPLYLSLLVGGVCGLGVGVLAPFGQVPSLVATLPRLIRRLALASLVAFGFFTLTAGWLIFSSNLKLN